MNDIQSENPGGQTGQIELPEDWADQLASELVDMRETISRLRKLASRPVVTP